jgi:hypothetical protein
LALSQKADGGGITPVVVSRQIMLRIDLHRSKIVPLAISYAYNYAKGYGRGEVFAKAIDQLLHFTW